MKNKLLQYCAIIVAACALMTTAARADALYQVSTLDGSQGFGHDPDKPAPTVTSLGFYAAGSANGGSGGDYNSIRFTPAQIGMTGLTLGDIVAVSYDAMNAIGGSQDWRFKVYTEPSGGPSWYGARVEAPTTTSGTTLTHHDLTSYARLTVPGTGDYYGATAASLVPNYASQLVMFFDISAGANSGGYDYDTYLNNIKITANGFGTSTIQAAVVPLPAAAWGGIALFGLIGAKRRFGKARQT